MNPTKKMIEDRITSTMVRYREFFKDNHLCMRVTGFVRDEIESLYKEVDAIEAIVREEINPEQFYMTIEEMRLVDYDKPVDALKLIRQRTGMGLKEAKDVMDKYRFRNGR